MCGIVGYVGKKQAVPILIDGLSKLEYRGYDSAGVAVMQDGKIEVKKAKGRLAVLEERLNAEGQMSGVMGIGHTRWATHGEPSDTNAHPHLSKTGKFAVVHNGIIENYIKLREYLTSKGFEFISETDTEVIAQLLEKYYSGSLINAVSLTCEKLVGSFALAIVCKDCTDRLVCVRRASPLIIGKGNNCNFISSDVNAISDYTDRIFKPDENVIAVVKKDSVSFYDRNLKPVSYDEITVSTDTVSAEKGGFEHFMLKEIHEQPEAVRKTVEAFDFEKIQVRSGHFE